MLSIKQLASRMDLDSLTHAAGVKRILRYLKKTKTEGLILKPGSDQRVDCYVDADFGGLFSVEDKQDPVSVKSRTASESAILWVLLFKCDVTLQTKLVWTLGIQMWA